MAWAGPAFVTTTVYVSCAPATIGSGAALLLMLRSAWFDKMVVVTPALLLVVMGSAAVGPTVTSL